ncbi:hypothetical protein DAMA08_002620 [Martiniozyma asiatica (nom. inval.)]|nr:hypothetical protein DAMA08_002620 [Martiniozyma asiatica]
MSTRATSLKSLLEQTDGYFGKNQHIKQKITSLEKIIDNDDHLESSLNDKEGIKMPSKTITLGIRHAPSVPAGLLTNALIADPLSDSSPTNLINQYRSLHASQNIKLLPIENNPELSNKFIGSGVFQLTSEFLNREKRVIQDAKRGDQSSKYLQALKDLDVLNNIAIVEVNDLNFQRENQIEGANKDLVSFLSNGKNNSIAVEDIQIWIYVTNDAMDVDLINDYPYYVVINKDENDNSRTFKDRYKENDLIVDLKKLQLANELLSKDLSNVSTYLKLHQESNINELLYTLSLETAGFNTQIRLLKALIRDITAFNQSVISSKEQNVLLEDESIRNNLQNSIRDWSQSAHFDLQMNVSPYLNTILLKKYSSLAQLIINSSDLSIILSNAILGLPNKVKIKNGILFGKTIEGNGSLKEFFGKAKYLEGKIDSILPTPIEESITDKTLSIEKIEKDAQVYLEDKILPNLQQKLNEILVNQLTLPPLAVLLVSTLGFIQDLITLNTGCSLTLLSVVLGAWRAQNQILPVMKAAKAEWVETLRDSIESAGSYLSQRVISNIDTKGSVDSNKRMVFQGLRDYLHKLEVKNDSLLKIKK